MNAVCRRWFLDFAVAGLAGLAAGCNLGSLAYFLTPEQRNDAKLKHLAHKDKKKAPSLVILTHHKMDVDLAMINSDHEVAERLCRELNDLAKAYSETVDIIPQRRVEDYKRTHPSWPTNITAVGEHFKADFVIYLEFLELSMRDRNAVNMYCGKATVNIELFEIAKIDDTPLAQTFTLEHPGSSMPGIPADEMSPSQFRKSFLDKIAKKLVPYFANYPREELYKMEHFSR